MRKPVFAFVKTKTQINCPITTLPRSAFDFPYIIIIEIQVFKPLAIHCCTAQIVYVLVETLEDRFSHDTLHFKTGGGNKGADICDMESQVVLF